MNNKKLDFVNQAENFPFESIKSVEDYFGIVNQHITWNKVGILSDENIGNVIYVLLDNESIQATFRFSLNTSDSEKALQLFNFNHQNVLSRTLQGHSFSSEDISTIESLRINWERASGQSAELNTGDVTEFFDRIETGRKIKGRGKDFSKLTRDRVFLDSHSRCMFTGCGERLDIDALTGNQGNFSYLAHNVAASENGERGIPLVSAKLADDPSNVLLLCDKHHRLIDKVAACDYTAETLTNMRHDFCHVADSLLDGLCYQPIPVYSVMWPVNSQVGTPPNQLQVSKCLARTRNRIHGVINILSDNEDILRKSADIFWQIMPNVINNAADSIIQQTSNAGYRSALFAFGPMPALIGLGAKLGNKVSSVPMLNHRDSGQWSWPGNEPVREDFYTVKGLNKLVRGDEFIIKIALTADVDKMNITTADLLRDKEAQLITISAKDAYMGNGAISHPEDGFAFRSFLQKLFHQLKSEYAANKIHLIVCASNAASVFIGQAIDAHHPDVLVYDFGEDKMVPRLLIRNQNYETNISLPEKV
jgi:hypothetical protein